MAIKINGRETKKETYHYQVLFETEDNFYHDSDFYAWVPDSSGGFKRVGVGSTRCVWMDTVIIDAPPSLYREYTSWEKREDIKREFANESRLWEKLQYNAGFFIDNLTSQEFDKIERLIVNSNYWMYIIKSLSRAKRSKFKMSLREQVLEWARSDSNYEFPLSQRQTESMSRYYKNYETY